MVTTIGVALATFNVLFGLLSTMLKVSLGFS